MRIASIHLRNFKRFTDLEIRDIPETARLVVVVGPNGCGKSSLFDALLHWHRLNAGFGSGHDLQYYRKVAAEPFDSRQNVSVVTHGGEPPRRDSFYMRTAYRNDPDFSVTEFARPGLPSETARFSRAIENDQAVSENYRRLVYETMSGVYDDANNGKTVEALREELIGSVRDSMRRVFGDLVLNSISDPLGSGSFYFQKGAAESYHYKNLSGGEKAAFDLLLDMLMKRRFFADAIYCIDEIDAHLHTRVQGALLKEMVRILPESSQLWVTTHSLGALRAAQDMMASTPGSVCLIDFDGVDPDIPRDLVPSSLGRVTWEKLLSITLDDLSTRIAPKTIVVCEGSSVGNRRKDFDAEIYNRVLGNQRPDVIFVSGGSAREVSATGVSVRELLLHVLPSTRVVGLVDRDDRSQAEVGELESHGDLVLPLRNLESYLLADDVLEALLVREGKPELLSEVFRIRAEAVATSVARRNASDDLKSAAGDFYVGMRNLVGVRGGGNSSDAFMRDTLAPLIQEPMPTFTALQAAILDRIP